MLMYVCMHACMYMCMYAGVQTYVYMYEDACRHLGVLLCVYYVYVLLCVYVHTCKYTRICLYICVSVGTHVHQAHTKPLN